MSVKDYKSGFYDGAEEALLAVIRDASEGDALEAAKRHLAQVQKDRPAFVRTTP